MVRSARKGASRTTRAFAPLHPLEEVGGEVALGEGGQDGDDQLAGHLRPGADLEGGGQRGAGGDADRSEEHTSELQSLMRISYAVFCLKKKNQESTTPKEKL